MDRNSFTNSRQCPNWSVFIHPSSHNFFILLLQHLLDHAKLSLFPVPPLEFPTRVSIQRNHGQQQPDDFTTVLTGVTTIWSSPITNARTFHTLCGKSWETIDLTCCLWHVKASMVKTLNLLWKLCSLNLNEGTFLSHSWEPCIIWPDFSDKHTLYGTRNAFSTIYKHIFIFSPYIQLELKTFLIDS